MRLVYWQPSFQEIKTGTANARCAAAVGYRLFGGGQVHGQLSLPALERVKARDKTRFIGWLLDVPRRE